MVTYNTVSNYFQLSSKCQPLSSSHRQLVLVFPGYIFFMIKHLCEIQCKIWDASEGDVFIFASLVSSLEPSKFRQQPSKLTVGEWCMVSGLHSLWLCREYWLVVCCQWETQHVPTQENSPQSNSQPSHTEPVITTQMTPDRLHSSSREYPQQMIKTLF